MSAKTKKVVAEKTGPASKPFSLYPLSTEEALRVLLKAKPIKKESGQKIAPRTAKKSHEK